MEEMITIQMQVPKEMLAVAQEVASMLLQALEEAQSQAAQPSPATEQAGQPGQEMTPDQLALQGEIDAMSQLR